MPDTVSPPLSLPLSLPGEWRLWEQFALRGPGFPASGVLRLAPDGLAETADKFETGATLHGPDWLEFEQRFGAAMVGNVRTLQRIAAQPAFRAAVAWQNPAVLDRAIGLLLAWQPSAGGRTSKRREREELVAHYWQRFCVKNDTIGFFGPVGWGQWDLTQPGIAVDPGAGLIAETGHYFSSWAIDAVAKAIDTDGRLRQWLAPRRVPFVRLDGEHVCMPGRPPELVEPLPMRVLAHCDGTRPPAALARAVSATESEVTVALDWLVARRFIVWRLEVPASAYPERHLRATLARVPDPDVRDRALAKLAILERGRERICAAGTDADALAAAFTVLETDFRELTSTSGQRAKGGRTAPCRALVYSDCRRSATVRIGTDIRDELTPLALCLTAARWLTGRFAEVVGGRIRDAYTCLRDRQGTVDLASLWLECLPVPHGESANDIDRIQAELRTRWARIISAPAGTRRVQLSSVDIADRVRAEFGTHAPAWPLARYVSPDVFVIPGDDVQLVLGELHVAMNTIATSLWVEQHPDVASLLAETNTDFPGARLLSMLPKEQPPRWSARSRHALDRPADYYVALVDHTADPHRARTLLAADVEVREQDDRLVVELPDGAVFDLIDVFGNAMTNRVIDRFTLRQEADHSPRVTVDRMIVARESWRLRAADLEFATEKNEARRFVRARWWQAALDLPRFVFVTSPAEPRPFYVDFAAPVYVNILAKAIRRLGREHPDGRLTITEMLPTPEQAWLTDDDGNRYTAELRFVAVDQSGVPS